MPLLSDIHPDLPISFFKNYFEREINRKIQETGLTMSHVPFLMEIGRNDGMSLKELTKNVCVDKALTTRVAKQLFEGGYIKDTSTSKRIYSVKLTEKGMEAERIIHRSLSEVNKELFDYFTKEEQAEFMRMMLKLKKKMEEHIESNRI